MCNPCVSKAALLLKRWPEIKLRARISCNQVFYLLSIKQNDESARDVYPPWVCVCLICMKGILLSLGRHFGGNTFRIATKGWELRSGGGWVPPCCSRLSAAPPSIPACFPPADWVHGRSISISPAPPSGPLPTRFEI